MPSQQQSSKTPIHLRDRLMTPEYLYDYFDGIYSFTGDACANGEDESRHANFLSPEDDALNTSWKPLGTSIWCNPPYSQQEAWVDAAIQNAEQHDLQVAMLLPTFNGQSYWEKIADKLFIMVNIIGRIDFISPEDFEKEDTNGRTIRIAKGDPIKGNSSGSCVVQIRRTGYHNASPLKWVRKVDMQRQYAQKLEDMLL